MTQKANHNKHAPLLRSKYRVIWPSINTLRSQADTTCRHHTQKHDASGRQYTHRPSPLLSIHQQRFPLDSNHTVINQPLYLPETRPLPLSSSLPGHATNPDQAIRYHTQTFTKKPKACRLKPKPNTGFTDTSFKLDLITQLQYESALQGLVFRNKYLGFRNLIVQE